MFFTIHIPIVFRTYLCPPSSLAFPAKEKEKKRETETDRDAQKKTLLNPTTNFSLTSLYPQIYSRRHLPPLPPLPNPHLHDLSPNLVHCHLPRRKLRLPAGVVHVIFMARTLLSRTLVHMGHWSTSPGRSSGARTFGGVCDADGCHDGDVYCGFFELGGFEWEGEGGVGEIVSIFFSLFVSLFFFFGFFSGLLTIFCIGNPVGMCHIWLSVSSWAWICSEG